MTDQVLKNKPLVEAMLEVKWGAIPHSVTGPQFDPNYKLFLGRLYDRTCDEYPVYEPLPAASIPDEIAVQVVQYRFRRGENDWPLIQVGPGIFTVNETQKYVWTDFKQRCLGAVDSLFRAYPGEMNINSIMLRYIDALAFDYASVDAYAFLEEKMNLRIGLPGNLFDKPYISKQPEAFTWLSSFRCDNPHGVVKLRFSTGQKDGQPCLIWETMVQSVDQDVPKMPECFQDWLVLAHEITHDWFFKLIEGDLKRMFKGE